MQPVRFAGVNKQVVMLPVPESQKGAADFIIFAYGNHAVNQPIACETKSTVGVQHRNQIRWQKKWENLGYKYYIVRDINYFVDVVMKENWYWYGK